MSIKETKFYQWLISCINLYSALKLEYLTPWHKDKYGYFAKNAAINTPFTCLITRECSFMKIPIFMVIPNSFLPPEVDGS